LILFDMMADAPQVAYDRTLPTAYHGSHDHRQEKLPVPMSPPKQQAYAYYGEAKEPTPQSRTILGLRKRNFWILVVVAIVIVAATIGGSVGGSLAVRKSEYVVAEAEDDLQQLTS
jgi:hypothetical protein